MPPRKSEPRKSDISTAPADPSPQPETQEPEVHPPKKDKDVTTIEVGFFDKASRTTANEQDLTLPKSIITRLAKGALPPNTQIQANAALAISKSAIVFISYLASHANENTLAANKKTIAPADVFKALDDIEFSFLKEPLEAEFAKFNAIQTEKRTSYRAKVKAAKDEDTSMTEPEPSDGHRAKKARVEPGGEETEDEDAEVEDDKMDEEEEEDDEEAEEEEEEQLSGEETQELDDKRVDDDEALDGDESD